MRAAVRLNSYVICWRRFERITMRGSFGKRGVFRDEFTLGMVKDAGEANGPAEKADSGPAPLDNMIGDDLGDDLKKIAAPSRLRNLAAALPKSRCKEGP